MSNLSFSVKYFAKLEKAKNGQVPVYGRITVNRKKVEFAIRETVPVGTVWESGYPKRCKELVYVLDTLKSKIIDIRRNLIAEGTEVTAALIKERLLGGTKDSADVIQYLQGYINRLKAQPEEYSTGTVKNYISTKNHVVAFLHSRGKKSLSISDITPGFLMDWDDYMLSTPTGKLNRPLERNSASKYHSKLRAVLNYAIVKGDIQVNPYDNFKVRIEKTNRTYLSKEEVKAIEELDLRANKSLDRVRDIFLFSVYTGLRYSDVSSLRAEHIKKEENGMYWISCEQIKTDLPVDVPLFRVAENVFHKYEKEREVTGYVLPQITNQKLNAYLKVIADLAGIDKYITHHVARHTFATTISLENNVPIEVVSKMLGHSSLKTTQIYGKITKRYLAEHASRLNEKL